MLLTRLVLRNFLAYQAEQTIDFQGIGLAALSGTERRGQNIAAGCGHLGVMG